LPAFQAIPLSGTAESLRRKIESAGDLYGVVRSMKALAASSVGQYEDAVLSLNHYYRTVELGLAACFRRTAQMPFLLKGTTKKRAPVGIVIFGSDQGLVGQFNECLADYAVDQLKAIPGTVETIWGVGERIQTLMRESGVGPVTPLDVPSSVHGITRLTDGILVGMQAALEHSAVREIYVFHNRPKPGALLEPVMRRLLPLDQIWQNSLANLPWPTKCPPEVIGGAQPALAAFIRGYLFVLLFQACAESLASENASRLAAMQRSEKNIQEALEDLNRKFHRIRKEAIDDELFDVISSYEAGFKKA
jgi:F-type H+-transporting ATPase subunit gamma